MNLSIPFLIIMSLIFLILVIVFVNIFMWRWTVGWAPTEKDVAEKIIELAEIEEGDNLFDLGSGDGRFLLLGAKEGAEVTGIEVEPLMYVISKIRALLSKNRDKIKMRYGNFFNLDLSEADVVILYLLPNVNEKLKPKLEKELKPGAVVISYYFRIPSWKIDKEIKEKEIYYYKIPEK